MLSRLKTYAKIIPLYPKLPDLDFLKKCIDAGVYTHEFKLVAPGQLECIRSGIIVHRSKNDYLIGSIDYINDLCEKAGAVFRQFDGKLMITLAGLELEITNAEELFILHEIFVKGVYNYWGIEEFVVVDIGMNVGISSLYFAASHLCKEVIGYEPFKPTYDQALTNIRQNKSLGGKIKTHNFGLGDHDEKLELKYNPALKSGMSTVYANPVTDNSDSLVETVEIRNVQKAFDDLNIDAYKEKGYKVVLKMDCEGAEYHIIPELKRSGFMRRIDAMMIEWHGNQAGTLKTMLTKEGFSGLLLDDTRPYGMIYAFRN